MLDIKKPNNPNSSGVHFVISPENPNLTCLLSLANPITPSPTPSINRVIFKARNFPDKLKCWVKMIPLNVFCRSFWNQRKNKILTFCYLEFVVSLKIRHARYLWFRLYFFFFFCKDCSGHFEYFRTEIKQITSKHYLFIYFSDSSINVLLSYHWAEYRLF